MKRATSCGWLFVFAITAVTGCSDAVVPDRNEALSETIASFQLAPLPAIPYPTGNTFNPERIALGQLLFFDPILGGESAPWVKEAAGLDPYRYRGNDMACGTCHFPSLAWTDGRRLGAGVSGAQFGALDLGAQRVVPGPSIITGEPVGTEPRNSPSILNTAFNGKNSITPTAESFQFMDGRVTDGLEGQAIKPITSRDEMAGDAYGPDEAQDSVVARLRAIPEYVSRFRQAFAGEIDVAADITIEHLGRAIAAFEREVITPDSRYDRFVAGDFTALNAVEKDGFELFFGKGLCGDCHFGPMLSDFTMRAQGVGDGYEGIIPGFGGKSGTGEDFGRFHADPIQFAGEKFRFRVQTVRNVEVTGPYFHSGSAGTLHEVVEFYNRGGLGPQDLSNATLTAAGATRDPSIQPLGLTVDEIDAVVEFMKTTTAPVQPGPAGLDLNAVPLRVPSGLVPPGVPTPTGPGPFLVGGRR
ncbi:MAG: hypothetical protein O3B84_05755 [Chloroflexi bacterium]|nr:hypothetical protein [Chloroflexota bacterium]